MLQFKKAHGNNKAGDEVVAHPHQEYLLRMGVLEQTRGKKSDQKTAITPKDGVPEVKELKKAAAKKAETVTTTATAPQYTAAPKKATTTVAKDVTTSSVKKTK